MRLTSKRLILVLAAVAALGIAAVGILFLTTPVPRLPTSGPAVVGKENRAGTPVIGGPFTLVSTDGETVTDQSFRGKWLLIFFGYTSCPDLCPTALTNVSVALEKFGADTRQLQPLFVTVDPQRDTRDVMADYLRSFDSRILGLTGTQAQIDSVIKEYRLYVMLQKSETGADDYLVEHSAYIYLMDPDGKFVNVIQGNEDGEAIAAWLRKEMTRAMQRRRLGMKYTGHLTSILPLILLLGGQAYAQASGQNAIVVERPWARATPAGAKNGAAYVTLINNGNASDSLLSATTPIADRVQFHSASEEHGVSRMREMRTVEVAHGARVTFTPGGMHIMVVGLKQPLKEGQTFPLSLTFEKAGKVDVTVPVAKVGAMQGGSMGSMTHGADDPKKK